VRGDSACLHAHESKTLLSSARAFTGCTLGLDPEPIEERAFLVPAQESDAPAVETNPVGR
jgi:hypothetical protein